MKNVDSKIECGFFEYFFSLGKYLCFLSRRKDGETEDGAAMGRKGIGNS
jgi:hypothetical protein